MERRYFDNHTHSYFSADSRMSIDDAVKVAYERGLRGICLTDHLDFDAPPGVTEFTFEVPAQQEAIDAEVEYFGLNGRGGRYGDFQLLKGVEIGLQDKSMPRIRKVLEDYRYDCVIGSLHLIDGHDPYFGDYYRPYTYRYAYGHYLEEFARLIRVMPDFDILGHYDYITRYPDYKETTIHYSEFGDALDAILTFLAENGKTMEINSSGVSGNWAERPSRSARTRMKSPVSATVSTGAGKWPWRPDSSMRFTSGAGNRSTSLYKKKEGLLLLLFFCLGGCFRRFFLGFFLCFQCLELLFGEFAGGTAVLHPLVVGEHFFVGAVYLGYPFVPYLLERDIFPSAGHLKLL